jgi:hypothetical protein
MQHSLKIPGKAVDTPIDAYNRDLETARKGQPDGEL